MNKCFWCDKEQETIPYKDIIVYDESKDTMMSLDFGDKPIVIHPKCINEMFEFIKKLKGKKK